MIAVETEQPSDEGRVWIERLLPWAPLFEMVCKIPNISSADARSVVCAVIYLERSIATRDRHRAKAGVIALVRRVHRISRENGR